MAVRKPPPEPPAVIRAEGTVSRMVTVYVPEKFGVTQGNYRGYGHEHRAEGSVMMKLENAKLLREALDKAILDASQP